MIQTVRRNGTVLLIWYCALNNHLNHSIGVVHSPKFGLPSQFCHFVYSNVSNIHSLLPWPIVVNLHQFTLPYAICVLSPASLSPSWHIVDGNSSRMVKWTSDRIYLINQLPQKYLILFLLPYFITQYSGSMPFPENVLICLISNSFYFFLA